MAYAFSSLATLALILAAVLALVWFVRLPAKRPNAMSCPDITWSRMDTPTNPMMVTAVMMFDELLDFERLKQEIEHRLLTFDRFRQRVIHDQGRHYWEDDPDFDLDFHVRRLRLPVGADQQALQESELAAHAFRATAAPQGLTRWLIAVRRGVAFLPALGKQLLLGPDARTILRGRVGGGTKTGCLVAAAFPVPSPA